MRLFLEGKVTSKTLPYCNVCHGFPLQIWYLTKMNDLSAKNWFLEMIYKKEEIKIPLLLDLGNQKVLCFCQFGDKIHFHTL